MLRRWLTFLVFLPIVAVLVVDQSICLACAADEPLFEICEEPSGLDELESNCVPGEDDQDRAELTCPLCVSRLFSLSASLIHSSFTEVNPFRSSLLSFHEQESCQSIFHPPQA
jgi:hypothetical protein